MATPPSTGRISGGQLPLQLSQLTSAAATKRPAQPLHAEYALWFSQNNPRNRNTAYEDNVKVVGKFGSLESFWSYFSHMLPAGELATSSDYHLFREGIRPMWEDDANKLGGKWVVRLRKGLVSRLWESLVFAIIGDQFDVGNEVCGAVVSIRYHEDVISVWNRTAAREDVTVKIKETMKRVMALPGTTVIEYKTHDSALRERGSFSSRPPGAGFREDGPSIRRDPGGPGGGGSFLAGATGDFGGSFLGGAAPPLGRNLGSAGPGGGLFGGGGGGGSLTKKTSNSNFMNMPFT